MNQPATFTQETWDRLVNGVDDRIERAVRSIIGTRGDTPRELAAGFNEMSKFWIRGGEDPNYDVRGAGLAYLLRYHPRTVSTAALVLPWLRLDAGARILDIGSGADAVALAWDLMAGPPGIDLTAAEPSREMRFAAQFISIPEAKVRRTHVEATFDDVASGTSRAMSGQFDAVVLSACLPLDFITAHRDSELRQIGSRLRDLLKSRGRLVVIEPGSRVSVLRHLARAISFAGLASTIRRAVDLAPRNVSLGRRLDRCTRFLIESMPGIASTGSLTTGAAMMPVDSRTGHPNPVVSWSHGTEIHYLVASALGAPSLPEPTRRLQAPAGVLRRG